MIIIKSINDIDNIDRSVVTIGNFDGLHKGHQVLIKEAVQFANKKNIKSVVFTFDNHPANYFAKKTIKNIITNNEKINRMKSLGVDILVIIPFNGYMTKISPIEFVKDILIKKLGARKIIVGHDFTFARRKEGNVKLLKELSSKYGFELEVVNPIKINDLRVSSTYIRQHDFTFARRKEGNVKLLKELSSKYGFELEVVNPIKINDLRVSSTYIRQLVAEGSVDKVNKYLGYNCEIKGNVIKCKQLGRKIGFPTANIEVNDDLLIPKNGIYATKVYIHDNVYYGATNIGYNPTVNGDKLSIETNILEFDEDIYGQVIKIEFLERIRDEKKFNSLDELKAQLKKDTDYVYKNYVCKNK